MRTTIVICAFLACSYLSKAQITYSNVAQSLGVDHKYGFGFNCGGLSFHDFNGDGYDDLTLLCDATDTVDFYLNNGTGFTKLSPPPVFVMGEAKQALWCDYDNDGDKDLFITRPNLGDKLFRCDGYPNFTDVSATCGIISTPNGSWGAAFSDYDDDGYLDLYVVQYWVGANTTDTVNHFYRNLGNGTFQDVTATTGTADSLKAPFCAYFFDMQQNGKEDIYIACDKMEGNTMLKNNGNGTFSDISASSGTNLNMDAMSVSYGDYDDNGTLDIYVTNTPSGNALLHNHGNETFSDSALFKGVSWNGTGWGALFIDIDLDKDLDLYVSGEYASGVQSQMFENMGGVFAPAITAGFAGDTVFSFGSAWGDINNDGYPDIAETNWMQAKTHLWKNSGGGANHWLKLSLEGTTSNRDAIGSLIEYWIAGKKRIRYTHCGYGYLGQNSSREMIGLGSDSIVDSLIIHWPAGSTSKYYNVCGDRTVHIVEGVTSTPATTITYSGAPGVCPGGTKTLNAGNFASFIWSTGDTTQTIGATNPGGYSVIITDFSGLCANASVSLGTSPPPGLTLNATNISCNGMSDGEVTATGSGTSPFSYIWNTLDTAATIMNLNAGTYSVTVTDAEGCTATSSTSIVEPSALSGSFFPIPGACYGDSTGMLLFTPSGGTTPYSYSWSNGMTSQSLSGVPAGNYFVDLTDTMGCSFSDTSNLSQPSQITHSTTTTSPSCNGGSNGAINVNPSGGTPGYSCVWSTGDTSFSIGNLTAGTYSITITDNNTCQVTDSFTLSVATTVTITTNQSEPSCFGGANGQITAIPGGGVPSYSFLWSTGDTTATISNLSAGSFSVTVTDDSNCAATKSVSLSQPAPLNLSTNGTDPNCFGDSTGTATATAGGGTPGYTYNWNSGATGSSITNLPAGTYIVTVNDTNGCMKADTTLLTQPPTTTIGGTTTNPTCPGFADGSISTTVSGGTPGYSYLWSNGDTSANITNLPNGTYILTLTDSKACQDTASFVLNSPSPMTATNVTVNPQCNGDSTGSIDLTLTGGTLPMSILWSNGDTTADIDSLPAGIFSIVVVDSVGCSMFDTIAITQPDTLLANLNKTDETCVGSADATATSSPTGGTIPYSFLWSNGSSTASVNTLSAGPLSVTVTDSNGCTTTDSIDILSLAPGLTIDLGPDITIMQGDSATIDAGPGFTSYSWSHGDTTQTTTVNVAGTYSVTVMDSTGCSGSDTITLNVIVGFNNHLHQTIEIFPNPSTAQFSIRSKHSLHDIRIIDALGKHIEFELIRQNANYFEVNLAAVSQGIYYIQLGVNQTRISKKLLVRR